MQLLIDSNNVCELYNLRNNVDNTLVNDATVNLTIYDGTNTPIGGAIWPADMANRGAGRYRVTLEKTLILDRGRPYYGVITATDPDGRQGQWELQLTAEPRKVF